MAHGSCLFPGAERRSIVTLKVLASTGVSEMVPDIRLLVDPVGERLAVSGRPGAAAAAGAPAGVAAPLELLELDAQPASAKASVKASVNATTAGPATEGGRI